MADITRMYTGGDYLANSPNWHIEDVPWKAQSIMRVFTHVRRRRPFAKSAALLAAFEKKLAARGVTADLTGLRHRRECDR